MFFSASIVRRRPLWHAGALGPGRSSKRFVGKPFPLKIAPFSKACFLKRVYLVFQKLNSKLSVVKCQNAP